MTEYKIAVGHDVALVTMVRINPQPKAQPVAPVQREYGASPSYHEQGLYVCLEWDYIFSETEYVNLLAYFDFDDQDVAAVTVYCRDQNFAYNRYNGYAFKPKMGEDVKWENMFISGVKVYITDLEAL